MKFILVLSDYEYLKGKMYIFDLLVQQFGFFGHHLDWFNIDQYKQLHPSHVSSYDVLLFNNAKLREPYLVKPFLKKPMITFKTGTNLEMFSMHPSFRYALPTSYFLNSGHNEGKLFLTHPKTFPCPIFCAYQLPKPNPLTKSQFYKKYQIANDRKLVIFLPGLLDKLIRLIKKPKTSDPSLIKFFRKVDWVLHHVDWLQNTLANLGYELLVKNHCRTQRRFKESMHPKLSEDLSKCKVIDLEDGYEAYHYSDFAITIGSSIVYELYLYDLPTLELGFGKYLYRWSKFRYTQKALQYYRKYDQGKALIFGKVCTDEEFHNLEQTLKDFSENLPSITDFKYRDHHPLLGTTYHQTVEKMAKLIIKQVD